MNKHLLVSFGQGVLKLWDIKDDKYFEILSRHYSLQNLKSIEIFQMAERILKRASSFDSKRAGQG